MQAAFSTEDSRVLLLFEGIPGAPGMVLSALEGWGRVWVDSPVHPRCAVAAGGDFLFCGGEPGLSATRLLRTAMASEKRLWLIRAPGRWKDVLERVTPTEAVTRWAFDHDVQPKDQHLRRLLKQLPAGAAFQPIEDEWIAWCRGQTWSEDFVSLYSDEDYVRRGLGVLVLAGNEAVAGASSYLSYPSGLEIQLQTRDDMQGRGYATMAAAKLILMAHERGMSVTWDAANEASAHIAQKLGYRLMGPYTVYTPSKP